MRAGRPQRARETDVRPLVIFHVVAGGALLALAIQALLNVRHLPRLERMPPPSRFPRVAVLRPARNEAARIGETVRAWTQQSYPEAGIRLIGFVGSA